MSTTASLDGAGSAPMDADAGVRGKIRREAPEEPANGGESDGQHGPARGAAAVDVTLSLKVQTPQGEVNLDQVHAGDTVVGLRQLLADDPKCCMYTNFHLALSKSSGANARKLNDFTELSSIEGLRSGSTLHMVLDKYTARTARLHVRRFRELLSCAPAPHVTAASGSATPEGDDKDAAKPGAAADGEVDTNADADAATADARLEDGPAAGEAESSPSAAIEPAAAEQQEASGGDSGDSGTASSEEADLIARRIERQMFEASTRQKDLAEKMPPVSVPVKPVLSEFYPAPSAFARDTAESMAEAEAADEPLQKQLPQCVRSVVFSGWNPPPSNRRLLGDLFYLQVTTLEGFVFHVTATPPGFFINSTRGDRFNPAPSHNPCHAHSLVELLSQASSDFSREFNNLLRIAAEAAEVTRHPVASPWDAVLATPWQAAASLASGGVVASGTVGAARQWNADTRGGAHGTMAPPTGDAPGGEGPYPGHKYDLNRAEESFMNAFGMEERGSVRDWNEEYQCVKDLPRETLEQRITRARSLSKIQSEFVDAATQGAVAVVQGAHTCTHASHRASLVPPIPPLPLPSCPPRESQEGRSRPVTRLPFDTLSQHYACGPLPTLLPADPVCLSHPHCCGRSGARARGVLRGSAGRG